MFDRLFETLIEEDVLHEAFGVVEAGWIHPNGSLEELKNYVMGDHDKDAFRKVRPDEDIPEGIPSFPIQYKEYVSQGHIRYLQTVRGFNIELVMKPTEYQLRAIRKEISIGTGEFFFSIAPSKLSDSYGVHGSSWNEFRDEMNKLWGLKR